MSEMRTLKQVRGQLRQVAQEMLPQLLTHEMFVDLQKQILERLNYLADMMLDRITKLEEKQKDFQNFLMRELAKPAQEKQESSPPPDQL